MRRSHLIILALGLALVPIQGCDDDDPATPDVQVPTRLQRLSGDGQVAAVSSFCPEPLVVRVTTQNGQPAADVQVYFGTDAESGVALSDTLAVTDASGVALTWAKLGTSVGGVQVRATAPGLAGSPVTFNLQAVAADAAILEIVAGNEQTGVVGSTLSEQLVVIVRDGYDNPVDGASVVWDDLAGGGAPSPAVAETDTAGLARTTWTLGPLAGQQGLRVRLAGQGYPNLLFVAQALPGAVDSLVIMAGDGVGGAVGDDIVIGVRALDPFGNAVPAAAVTFELVEGTGALAATDVETDAGGDALTALTLGAAGLHRVTATCAGAAPVTLAIRSYNPVLMVEPAVTLAGIHLLWSYGENPGFAGAELYRAEIPDVDRDAVLVAAFPDANTTDHLDTTVVTGRRYYYRLYVNYFGGFNLPSAVVSAEAGVRVELPGVGFQMEHDTARNRVWVSIPANNSVVAFSASNFRVLQEITVGPRPCGIDLSADGATLYCALNGAGAVAVLDIASGAVSEIDIGTQLGDARTWDVLEHRPGELVVTSNPGSNGSAYVVRIDRNAGDAATRLANERNIRAAPTLVPGPQGRYVYVGEGFSPNSLYKLDMDVAGGPIVLEDDHGAVSGTNAMTVNAAGDRIFLRSGQVLRTASFNQAGIIGAGVPALAADDAVCYVGTDNPFGAQSLQAWDTATFLLIAETPLPAAADAVLLLDAERIVVLADDLVHGIPAPGVAR